MLQTVRGSLVEEAILLNGPYQGRCVRYTVPGKGIYYMGALVVHGVSYQWKYMPSRPVTKVENTKLWAQLVESIVSVK